MHWNQALQDVVIVSAHAASGGFLFFFFLTLLLHWLQCCGVLPYMGMPAPCSQCCACPMPHSAQAPLTAYVSWPTKRGYWLNCCWRTAVTTLLVEEWEVRAVSNILSVTCLCLFCVSNWTKGVVSTVECGDVHRGGKGGGGSYTDRFETMQTTQGRQKVWVTVFWRSTDFTVLSVVFSCFIGVQNQNQSS